MITRMKIYAMAAATLLVSASQAGAQPDGAPAYRMTFYNNAAHQTQVGTRVPWGCDYDEFTGDVVNYRQFGSSSPYHDEELVGYCSGGAYNPV
jgi:hypothetical protein